MGREVKLTPQQSTFTIGDRVVIVHRPHPWWGEAGTIVEDFPYASADLRWSVELSSGHRCAVAEREIKHV